MGTNSVSVSLSQTLVLLIRIPSYILLLLLLLLCNTEPTRALSIDHPPTLRVALIHGTYRGSRISWLRLPLLLVVVVNARRGRGRPLMNAWLKRRHRGRGHATRAAVSTIINKTTQFTRRLWDGGGGPKMKTVIRCLEVRCDVRIRVFFFSGHGTSSFSFFLRDTL